MIKGGVVKSLALAVGLVALCGAAFAHHGTSAYDEQHPVTMTGTITLFWFTNPHVLIMYDVKDAQGNVTHWSVETHDPRVVKRTNNWERTTLKPGDSITITVYPGKGNKPAGRLVKLLLNGPNGRLLMDETRGIGRAPVAP